MYTFLFLMTMMTPALMIEVGIGRALRPFFIHRNFSVLHVLVFTCWLLILIL